MQMNPSSCVEMLSVIRENECERKKMLEILELEPTRRKMALNILVTQMRRENAPGEFIAAWDALQDDAIADRVREILADGRFESETERERMFSLVVLLVLGGSVALGLYLYFK